MFEAAVSQEGKVRTINLQGVRGLMFIDSSGLRDLVMAKQRAESHGTKLSIVPGPTGVMRVFELVGFVLLEQLPFENQSAAS